MSEPNSNILTEESIPAYLIERADEIGLFPADATISAKAIQGGNVNFAFCITYETDGASSTCFLKQAPEYVAIFGPDGFPLTSARMQQEIDVFEEWKSILGKELSAKYMPTIYLFDKKNMVFVMDFLEGYELFDHVLVDTHHKGGTFHPDIAQNLGDFLGKTHAATHSSKISEERRKYLSAHFENRAMRDIQLEFVFTKCYVEATDEQREGVNVNEEFLAEIDLLKKQYDGKDGVQNLVLSHGDFHPGSVMVNNTTGDAKVIDPEFTVYGPPGLDVGSLLSGFVLAAIHQAYSNNPKGVDAICDGADAIWSAYKTAMIEAGLGEDILNMIEVETVGFAVAEVCRTAMEFAGGRKWLQFEDAKKKADAKKSALNVVDKCMIKRHDGGMQLLFDEMKSVASSIVL